MRQKLLVSAAVAVAALALASVALAGNDGFAPGVAHSSIAHRIQDIYWVIFGLTSFVFVVVEGLLIVFILRYRSRRRARTVEGPQIRGHHRLEIIWTTIPVLILAAIMGFVFTKLPGIKDVPSAQAANAKGSLHVTIEGHRFYWEFKYPNGVVAVNTMRVPVHTVVSLRIVAPGDEVIHSWWIPDLGGKTDAIPGHPNKSWFDSDQVGVYTGQCAELCGIQHAEMLATVRVMPRGDFQRWYASEARAQATGTSDLGKQTFQGVCAKCHGMNAQGDIGPKLAGNSLLSQRQAIATIVRNGRATMPDVGNSWPKRQVTALFQYLKRTYAPGATGTKTGVKSPQQGSSNAKGGGG